MKHGFLCVEPYSRETIGYLNACNILPNAVEHWRTNCLRKDTKHDYGAVLILLPSAYKIERFKNEKSFGNFHNSLLKYKIYTELLQLHLMVIKANQSLILPPRKCKRDWRKN
ncbi:hypothetical protein CHS0354_024523 [Potamilus streckersoni]|uniref:Uncharacterized protein n=1 Tax=Potamilus streckersoni TaxID=2493646 RepID=A0AAE0WHQ5_9BIVA|nr:hypothetical protein CHS0354_024523 [Potamilus streckersoni]